MGVKLHPKKELPAWEMNNKKTKQQKSREKSN